MRIFLVMIVCRLLVLAGGADTQEESAAKFRLTVNQIVVPVVVTDAKGHRVSGLRAEDFEVLEDGAPQKILSFSMGGEAVASIPAGKATSQPPDSLGIRQTYSICVDTLHSTFANFPPVRAAL